MSPIEIVSSQPIWTAVIRSVVRCHDLSHFVPAACGEVWSFVKSAGIPRPGRHVALYLDGRISVEVGVEVGEEFSGNGRVHCSKLPAGRAAHVAHFGPYGGLATAHEALLNWFSEHGMEYSGVSWEIYGHWEDAWNNDPSKIRTDIYYLLKDT